MDARIDPLPVGWPIDRAVPYQPEPLQDLDNAIEHALAHPLSSLPASELCGPGSKVTVVCAIAGHERDTAIAALLPALIRQLASAGVKEQDITILIPNGLHRPSTDVEKRHSLGDAIVDRYTIVDHDANDVSQLDDLGTFEGVPLQINYRAVEADLLIAVDVVEPHYYAGYSGGNKTISVGCAGEATLNEVRAARFLDDLAMHPPDTRDNLLQMVGREIARRAGLIFVLNAVVDVDGQIVAVSAGSPNAVHDMLVDFARKLYEVDVSRDDYNIVIAGNGRSRVRSLYQASRAAVAIGLAQEPVLVKGGVIILPVRCNTGLEPGVRERQFYEALASANDMSTVMRQLSQRGIRSGEQRAYMLAQTMIAHNYHVIVVGADCADLARDSGLIPAHDMLEAATLAETIVGKSPLVLMLPHAAHLIPIYHWRPDPDVDIDDLDDGDIYIQRIISDN
jgi:nickel-dependent lactate racemase